MNGNTLLCGAAQVDITPPAGVHLAGNIDSHRPAKLVWEPLYARARVLESEGVRVCIVTLNVTIVTGPCTEAIRGAAARFSLAPEAGMVHATQTHSAPGMGRFMVRRFRKGRWWHDNAVAPQPINKSEEVFASPTPCRARAGRVRQGPVRPGDNQASAGGALDA